MGQKTSSSGKYQYFCNDTIRMENRSFSSTDAGLRATDEQLSITIVVEQGAFHSGTQPLKNLAATMTSIQFIFIAFVYLPFNSICCNCVCFHSTAYEAHCSATVKQQAEIHTINHLNASAVRHGQITSNTTALNGNKIHALRKPCHHANLLHEICYEMQFVVTEHGFLLSFFRGGGWKRYRHQTVAQTQPHQIRVNQFPISTIRMKAHVGGADEEMECRWKMEIKLP